MDSSLRPQIMNAVLFLTPEAAGVPSVLAEPMPVPVADSHDCGGGLNAAYCAYCAVNYCTVCGHTHTTASAAFPSLFPVRSMDHITCPFCGKNYTIGVIHNC